jgi:phospholipid/cholesterol/gamma-HCH transport system substrate-binding protein
VGLVLFIGLAIFLWASIRGGAAFFERRSTLVAVFQNVGGLTSGSPIWFRGYEVGSVGDIAVEGAGDSSFVRVELSVRPEILPLLYADARARIDAINFFGEKFVDLVPGRPGAGPLDATRPIRSDDPADFGALVRSGERGVEDLRSAAADLASILDHVRRGEGSLGRLVADRGFHDDMRRFLQDAAALSRSLDASQASTATALASAASRLDTLLARVNRGEGSLGLLARDPALYRSLAGAAAGADTVFTGLAAGEGTLGKALEDEKAYDEMAQTLERMNQLLADIQRNPKKYFRFSAF